MSLVVGADSSRCPSRMVGAWGLTSYAPRLRELVIVNASTLGIPLFAGATTASVVFYSTNEKSKYSNCNLIKILTLVVASGSFLTPGARETR